MTIEAPVTEFGISFDNEEEKQINSTIRLLRNLKYEMNERNCTILDYSDDCDDESAMEYDDLTKCITALTNISRIYKYRKRRRICYRTNFL